MSLKCGIVGLPNVGKSNTERKKGIAMQILQLDVQELLAGCFVGGHLFLSKLNI